MHDGKHPPRQRVAGGAAHRQAPVTALAALAAFMREIDKRGLELTPKLKIQVGSGRGKCSDCDRGSQASTAAELMTAEVKLPLPRTHRNIFAGDTQGNLPTDARKDARQLPRECTNETTYKAEDVLYAIWGCRGWPTWAAHGDRRATPKKLGPHPRDAAQQAVRQSNMRTALDDDRHP